MMEPVRIFVSSTWEDLRPERAAVERALHRMSGTDLAGMEYFGRRPETPRDASLAEVDRSDCSIGIFGARYGSGITEAEDRRARGRGLACLIYLAAQRAACSKRARGSSESWAAGRRSPSRGAT